MKVKGYMFFFNPSGEVNNLFTEGEGNNIYYGECETQLPEELAKDIYHQLVSVNKQVLKVLDQKTGCGYIEFETPVPLEIFKETNPANYPVLMRESDL